jgi:hypothetical protein
MTERIELRTDGPHSPEYTRQVASALAECVRVLNHATLSHEVGSALKYPSHVDYVLVELASMALRLPQLCEQIATWLAGQHAAGRIAVTYGTYEGRPGAAGMAAEAHLDDAKQAAGEMYEALNAARQLTSAMSAPYDPAEDPDA